MSARESGEPLIMAYPEGDIPVAPSYIAAVEGAAHPAAARLLVQFQISEEFQQRLTEIGTRSVLEGAAVPEGLPKLAEDRLIVVGPEELTAGREAVTGAFTSEVVGGR